MYERVLRKNEVKNDAITLHLLNDVAQFQSDIIASVGVKSTNSRCTPPITFVAHTGSLFLGTITLDNLSLVGSDCDLRLPCATSLYVAPIMESCTVLVPFMISSMLSYAHDSGISRVYFRYDMSDHLAALTWKVHQHKDLTNVSYVDL